jgi:hypothetical protein
MMEDAARFHSWDKEVKDLLGRQTSDTWRAVATSR